MEEAGDLSWVIYRQGEKNQGPQFLVHRYRQHPTGGLNTKVIYISGSLIFSEILKLFRILCNI